MYREAHMHIVPYNPEWPTMFVAEKDRLLVIVESHVETIEHIGSTSVPGLAAKPVIDIIIGVDSLQAADTHCLTPIQSLGYEYIQAFEKSMPRRRYFRKSDETGLRTHQIHLWEREDSEYERHMLFRDYLRAHPHEAADYERVKRDLMGKHNSVGDYTDAKSAFIAPCQQRAYAWKRSR